MATNYHKVGTLKHQVFILIVLEDESLKCTGPHTLLFFCSLWWLPGEIPGLGATSPPSLPPSSPGHLLQVSALALFVSVLQEHLWWRLGLTQII